MNAQELRNPRGKRAGTFIGCELEECVIQTHFQPRYKAELLGWLWGHRVWHGKWGSVEAQCDGYSQGDGSATDRVHCRLVRHCMQATKLILKEDFMVKNKMLSVSRLTAPD